MFCNNCGRPLSSEDSFCAHCGKQQTISNTANVAPLLRRAQLFLESGELAKSDDYCEQVLDLDPENAQAYVIKLMIRTHVTKEEDLANMEESFANWNSYQNAYRFADDKLRQQLERYLQCVEKNIQLKNEQVRLQKEAAEKQEQEKLKQMREQHDYALYSDAIMRAQPNASIESLTKAISLFEQIPNYKDVSIRLTSCKQRLDALKEENTKQLLEQEQQEKNRKQIVIITAAIICFILMVAFGIWRGLTINGANTGKADQIKSQLSGVSFSGTYRTYASKESSDGDIFGTVTSMKEHKVTYTFTESGEVKVSTTTYYTKNPYKVIDGKIQWESSQQSTVTISDYYIQVSSSKVTVTINEDVFVLNVTSNNKPISMENGSVTYERLS